MSATARLTGRLPLPTFVTGLYEGRDEAGQSVAYADPKRPLWVLGTAYSVAVPFLAFLAYALSGGAVWTAFLIPLHTFGVIPLLDRLVGEDWHNPPEAVVPAMSADRLYSLVIYAWVPFNFVVFLGAMWVIAVSGWPLWANLALVFGVGISNGQAITLAHELGHRTGRFDRFMAKVSLALVGYGHFCAEHNRGHHVHVATPEDCASARMGESVYAFASRELPGACRGGWAQEARRLKAKGLPVWSPSNELLQVYAATALIALGVVLWLGLPILPWIVLHHFLGWWALTMVNYIEHYGLLRMRLPNGRYERVAPHHSWNTNHIVSNVMQIHLQRHSDHHANPQRPYQALRDFGGVPRLPSGYPGCLGMAFVPPLWFKVMDPKVMAWAEGDLSRAHVHEPARARLERRWGRA